jgi:spore coat protein U-like protein
MRCQSLIRRSLWALILALACITSAQADNKTCSITGAALDFGTYDPFASGADNNTGFVSVQCNGSINAKLSLSVGNGAGASYSAGRKMTRAGGATLLYNLYANSARTQVFGDGSRNSVTVDIHGYNNLDQPIYGRIPALQTSVAPGNYVDIVLVTISY